VVSAMRLDEEALAALIERAVKKHNGYAWHRETHGTGAIETQQEAMRCADLMPEVVQAMREAYVSLTMKKAQVLRQEQQLVAYDALLDGNLELAEQIAPGAFEVRCRHGGSRSERTKSLQPWLDAVARRVRAAAPGPWRVQGPPDREYVDDSTGLTLSSIWDREGHLRRHADGEFIAQARQDLPRAMMLVDAAETLARAARAEVEGFGGQVEDWDGAGRALYEALRHYESIVARTEES